MCAALAQAVNVTAPLTECTATEITVGQPAVRAESARPTDLDSSHTSSAAAGPTGSKQTASDLHQNQFFLLLSLNHLVTCFDDEKHLLLFF